LVCLSIQSLVNVGLLTKFEESDLLAKAQEAVQQWLVLAEQK